MDAFEILISASKLMLLTFKIISLVILPSIRNAMLALCLTFHTFYLLSLARCICNYLLKVHSAFDQKCIRTNNNNSIDAHLLSLSCAWQRTTFKFGQRASFWPLMFCHRKLFIVEILPTRTIWQRIDVANIAFCKWTCSCWLQWHVKCCPQKILDAITNNRNT